MTSHRGLKALAILLTSLALPAQKEDAEPPNKPTWPPLTSAQRAELENKLKLLASEKPETRQKASDEILVLGLGAGDRLLQRMSDSPHRPINEQLALILDELLKPEHAPLVALHAGHASVFARRYVMKTLCRFMQPDAEPVLRTALSDKDHEVRYYAALGLVRIAKDHGALDIVHRRCLEEWPELCDEVTRNLSVVRDEKFLPWIDRHLKVDDVAEQVATLRIMRAIAPSSAKSRLRRFLDSEQAILKKETINTLRVIVDGQEPLPPDKITVFMMPKMVNEWRARI